MLQIYLQSAIRNLRRNRTCSFLNIFGLAIGMAACIVILLFVYYEQSFDSMHHRNLYRLNLSEKFIATGSTQKEAVTFFPMGPTLNAEFPEVIDYSRVDGNRQYEMTYGDKRVFFPMALFVDTSFLQLFDFPMEKGERQAALQKPNSIVLTASAARTLFGAEEPIGKTVTHFGRDTVVYTVTGVLKDLPGNSQLQFDALQSFNTVYKADWMDHGDRHWVNTYLELAPGTNVAAFERKFPAYLEKHGVNSKDIQHGLFLLPLRDVHAQSTDIIYDDLNFQKFDGRYTTVFMIIGFLVLLIACVNFMNLATAQSAERAKEVGIRKTIGAMRSQLGLQFLVESVVLSLTALIVALGLLWLVLSYIDTLSGRALSPLFLQHPELLAAVLIGTIGLGLLSGIYPALYLSSFRRVKVLKGGGDTGKAKSTFRNILVVAQFASAIFLVIATILVFRQLNYMEHRDPGFDGDQVVVLQLHGITAGRYALLKQELEASPMVTGVTGAQDQLGGPLNTMGFGFWPGNKPMQVLFTTGLFVDPDYLSVYKIPLIAGRNFSPGAAAVNKEFIINETLARKLLKDQPGQPISWLIGKHLGDDTLCHLVGVTRDFNFNSLHYAIEPMFLLNNGGKTFGTASVKISGRHASQAIAAIEAGWKKILPEYPLDYQFLDDHFKELYRTDSQVSQMVAIMAGLAILISCLGLFGLVSFSAERRTKEIGIRKILGASVQDVVVLLSRHFVGLVLIANCIAWPLAWLALHTWIQGFAYRVAISWWVFALAGVVALAIALVTVSFRAVNAALANPVETMRTE